METGVPGSGDRESDRRLERFRNLAEQAHDLIAETDASGRYLFISPNHARVLGWPPEELKGREAFELVHPEDRAGAVEVFARGLRSAEAGETTCRLVTRDGGWRWFHITGRPYTDSAGQARVVLVGRDVTERRRAELALRESERRYRILVETASCGIVETDRDGRITFVNSSLGRLLGRSPAELYGRALWELEVDPERRERVRAGFDYALREEPLPVRQLQTLAGAEGTSVVAEIDWNYKRGEDGSIVGFVTVVTDVTRREQATAALEESHRFATRVAETSPAMLCVFDARSMSLVYVNARATQVLGWTAGELREMGPEILARTVHPDDRTSVEAAIARAMGSADDEVAEAEYRGLHRDGEWRWLHSHFAVFARDAAGTPRQLLVAHEDVGERRRAAEELRTQEERFRLLAENAGDIILEFLEDGRVSFVSPSWTALTGHPTETLRRRGMRWLIAELMHPDEAATLGGDELPVFREGERPARVWRMRHADGSWRWFEARASSYLTGDGERRALTIARDVTDRVRAAEALRASESRFRLVAESAYDFICELDPDGQVTYLSPSFRDILGFDPAWFSRTESMEMIHPEDLARVSRAVARLFRGEPMKPLVYRHRHASGAWRWLETAGRSRPSADGRRAAVLITRDITDKLQAEEEARRLQEQLLQAQKLESLGVLAGGIAHDFNNLLVGILGNASLALSDLAPDSPLRETLEGIETAALRAGELTNQMLAYSGKGRFVVQPLDLSALVDEMAHLLEASISKKASLRRELERSLPPVEVDATQIRQLVMNLITNASDALGEGAGSIVLRTRPVPDPAGETGDRVDAELARRGAVALEVEDTGCGMDAETRSRVFDPFFTTKFTGRGLGLAAALGIVRGHRGRIDVESLPGKGTRFRILLPVSVQGVRPALAQAAAPLSGERGRGRVLVVDDEHMVRSMASRTLRESGFEVLCAADGHEALGLLDDGGGVPEAVLLDLTMPRMGGEETLRELRRRAPEVPVVLTSGYSESEIATRFEGVRLEGFLHKPFRPAELVARIQEALARAGAGSRAREWGE